MFIFCVQLEKQKQREEQEKKLLEQRAQFIEKTKNILVFEPIIEDKPKKGARGVSRSAFPSVFFISVSSLSFSVTVTVTNGHLNLGSKPEILISVVVVGVVASRFMSSLSFSQMYFGVSFPSHIILCVTF